MEQSAEIGAYLMPRGAKRVRTPDGKLNQVGERVRERRKALKLTRDALMARLSHFSEGGWLGDVADVYRIERGQRSVHDIELVFLAKALECDPCWLLLGVQD